MKPGFQSEPPTLVDNPVSRLAKLASDWKQCPVWFQRWLERQAERGKKLSNVRVPFPRRKP